MTGPDDAREAETVSVTMLRRVREADPEAWARLVELFGPFVYRWVRRRGVSEADAPDLVQEVFIRVFRHARTFDRDSERSSFRGWLRTIAKNAAIDHLRVRKPLEFDSRVMETFAIDVDSDDAEASELLHRVLEMIRPDFSDRTWRIFWELEFEGAETGEVAARLQMKPSAIREAKRRVRNRLREECIELLGSDYPPFASKP